MLRELGVPLKNPKGAANVIRFPGEKVDAGNVAAETAKQPHAEGGSARYSWQDGSPQSAASTITGPAGYTGPTGNTGPTGQQSGTSPQSSEALNAAARYIRAGWHVFPGNRREKTPKKGCSWTKQKLTAAEAKQHFDKDQHNVLVALGKASSDLVDVDLDWVEATAAADLLMSALPSFGRSGKPRSHRLATCGDIKTCKYFLPQSLANHPKVNGEHAMCIAEIRSTGAYTVFPGSEHETGQKVDWTNASTDNIAAIQAIDAKALG